MKGTLVAALCLFATGVAANPVLDDAAYWMTRMLEAAESVSYQGELVHSQGVHRVQAMRIVRRAGPDGYRERLLTLDGPPTEVVRDGRSVSCVLPEGRASLAGRRVPRNPFPVVHWRYSDAVHDQYDFYDLGEGRVAGRMCKIIGVQPRHPDRYGYRLWLDVGTGLLLRSEVVDSEGATLEQVAFTRIDLESSVDEEDLAWTLEGEMVSWNVMPRGIEQGTPWSVSGMPTGFAFRGERVRDDGVVQQVFSDGLATVSIFVSPPGVVREGRLAGTSHMGTISAFGTLVSGRQVTVVGEVPVATVQVIGGTLVLQR